jgi:hypothetical protein
MSSEQFICRLDSGKEIGPVDANGLKRLAAEGMLHPDSMVQRVGGSGSWRRAGGIKGLVFASPAVKVNKAASPPPVLPVVPTASPVPTDAAAAVKRWWLAVGGQTLGPFAPADILQQFQTAGSPPGWQVRGEDDAQWTPIDTAPWFEPKQQSFVAAPRVRQEAKFGDIARTALRSIPNLLKSPVDEVQRIAVSHDDGARLLYAFSINACGMVAILACAYLRFKNEPPFANISMVDVTWRAFVALLIPFVSLALAGSVVRKMTVSKPTDGLGIDALSAAAALLPIQVASLIPMLLGIGNFELAFGVPAYALILSPIIMFGIRVRMTGDDANVARLMLLTPIQFFAAAYISKILLVELLPAMLPSMPPMRMPF